MQRHVLHQCHAATSHPTHWNNRWRFPTLPFKGHADYMAAPVSGVLRHSHKSSPIWVYLTYGTNPEPTFLCTGSCKGPINLHFWVTQNDTQGGGFQETVQQQHEDKKHPSVPVRVEFNKLQKSLVSKKCVTTLRQNAWQAQYDNGMVNMEIMRQVCSVRGRLAKRTRETAAEWYRQHKNKVGGTTKIENSWQPIDTSVMTSTNIGFRFEQT